MTASESERRRRKSAAYRLSCFVTSRSRCFHPGKWNWTKRTAIHSRRNATYGSRILRVFWRKKILIHAECNYKDRAKDLLYIHDMIEVFSESLEELQTIYQNDVAPKLHPRRRAEIEGAAGKLFGKVDDLIREAAPMAAGRKVSPERLAETSRAGLKEIFRS